MSLKERTTNGRIRPEWDLSKKDMDNMRNDMIVIKDMNIFSA